MQRIFHTPEGVRDIYSRECAQKHQLQERIRKVFQGYGYDEIETPTFEYFEVFSREVGKTFVEYLTETRMEKAKELLMCSPLKTSEIGYEVGYKDPHYFSYIFKKTQGCSPKDYRARRKE